MTGKYLKNNKAKKSKNIPKNTLNEGYAKTQNMQQTETKEESGIGTYWHLVV